MKVATSSVADEYAPITVEITFETEEELFQFYALSESEKIRKMLPDIDFETLGSDLESQYHGDTRVHLYADAAEEVDMLINNLSGVPEHFIKRGEHNV